MLQLSFFRRFTPGFTYLALLLFSVPGALYMLFTSRPLYNDGAFWLFSLMTKEEIFRDGRYHRYTGNLLQLPAYLYTSLSRNPDIQIGVFLFNLFHIIVPYLSLLFCFYFLRRKNSLLFFAFPLLSFFLATLSTFAFHVGSVPTAIALFWPILILLAFSSRSLHSELAFYVLSILLFFSYEGSLLLFFVLFSFSCVQLYKFRNQWLLFRTVFLFLNILLLIGLIFISHENKDTTIVVSNTLEPLSWFLQLSFLTILMLILLPMGRRIFAKSSRTLFNIFFCVLMLLGIAIIYYFQTPGMPLHQPLFSRLYALILAVMLGCFFVYIYLKNNLIFLNDGLLCFLLFTSFIGSQIYDLNVTLYWQRLSNGIKSEALSSIGCHCIESNRQINEFAHFFDWATPMHSIILQNTKTPESIVFFQPWKPEKANPCEEYKVTSTLSLGFEPFGFSASKYFDFSNLKRALDRPPN